MSSIEAVILAAGQSMRMGSPKALLPLGATTFLGRLIAEYQRLALPLWVVLGRGWQAIEKDQPVPAGSLLVNPEPEKGPLSSFRIALARLDPEASGVMLHPVDHPLVRRSTIEALVRLHDDEPEQILVPSIHGRGGHPTLFPARVFDELRDGLLEDGARSIVLADPDRVTEFETDDPGILRNIDTPEDYDRWVLDTASGGSNGA